MATSSGCSYYYASKEGRETGKKVHTGKEQEFHIGDQKSQKPEVNGEFYFELLTLRSHIMLSS